MDEMPFSINGVRVFVSPHIKPQPVLQINPAFEWITDEARSEINAWLLDMFGKRESVLFFNGAAYMSENSMRKLRLQSNRNSIYGTF